MLRETRVYAASSNETRMYTRLCAKKLAYKKANKEKYKKSSLDKEPGLQSDQEKLYWTGKVDKNYWKPLKPLKPPNKGITRMRSPVESPVLFRGKSP